MPVIPQQTIDFANFLDQADAGDIVLWQGTSLISLGVEIVSQSKYAHASMVIKNPVTGEKCLFQSVSEALQPDPLKGGTTHTGVQAGELKTTMIDVYSYTDYPSWIPLTYSGRNAAFDQAMWTFATTVAGTPFPVNPAEMAWLLIEGRYEGSTVTSPLFCSALVALTMQKAGIVSPAKPCNGFFPKDFSMFYPGYLDLVAGSYGEDVIVDMSGVPTKAPTT